MCLVRILCNVIELVAAVAGTQIRSYQLPISVHDTDNNSEMIGKALLYPIVVYSGLSTGLRCRGVSAWLCANKNKSVYIMYRKHVIHH